jgi:hypothetical protein
VVDTTSQFVLHSARILNNIKTLNLFTGQYVIDGMSYIGSGAADGTIHFGSRLDEGNNFKLVIEPAATLKFDGGTVVLD